MSTATACRCCRKSLASATLTHTLDFGDGSQLLSRVQVQYRDSYINAIFNSSPIYTSPSYVLWDLYFDYSFADANWDASLAIDNVFNKDAVVSKFTNQFGGETTQAYAAAAAVHGSRRLQILVGTTRPDRCRAL